MEKNDTLRCSLSGFPSANNEQEVSNVRIESMHLFSDVPSIRASAEPEYLRGGN